MRSIWDFCSHRPQTIKWNFNWYKDFGALARMCNDKFCFQSRTECINTSCIVESCEAKMLEIGVLYAFVSHWWNEKECAVANVSYVSRLSWNLIAVRKFQRNNLKFMFTIRKGGIGLWMAEHILYSKKVNVGIRSKNNGLFEAVLRTKVKAAQSSLLSISGSSSSWYERPGHASATTTNKTILLVNVIGKKRCLFDGMCGSCLKTNLKRHSPERMFADSKQSTEKLYFYTAIFRCHFLKMYEWVSLFLWWWTMAGAF